MRRIWLAMVALMAFSWSAAAQPTAAPMLRVETGDHVGRVFDAAVDGAGQVLVTVGYDDKTARIWSLPDLRPLGVLRPPIGDTVEGRLLAVAVSPDGRLAAVGGWLGTAERGFDILLFDLQTRQVARRVASLPGTVHAMAFSRDGRRLAAGLYSGGLRVFGVDDGRELAQDREYEGGVSSLDFAPDGRLASASTDGALRLYGADGRRLVRAPAEAGRRPYRVRFTPDGRLLAVGFSDALALEVRDGATLALNARPDVAGLDGTRLDHVGWRTDGQTLLAAGDVVAAGRRPVLGWTNSGHGPHHVAAANFLEVSAVRPLASGQLALAGSMGDLAVFGPGGARVAERRRGGGDLSRPIGSLQHAAWRLPLSHDGRVVEWAFFDTPGRRLRFDAGRLELEVAGAAPSPSLADWTPEIAELRLTDWLNGESPKLNGRPLALAPFELSRSAAVASGRALLGTTRGLRLFDGRGQELWMRPTQGEAWRVNLLQDGRLAVAALSDGTIRWHRGWDGTELLALFVDPGVANRPTPAGAMAGAPRWVAFTPGGLYAASPGGEELIGWHVNRSPSQAADFFGAARFRDRFYRPDAVARVLGTPDEAEALRQAGAAPPALAPAQDLPPVVTILSPVDGTRLDRPEATLEYTLRSPSGRPVLEVEALVDGRPVPGTRGLWRPEPPDAGAETRGRITVPIPPGRTVDVALLAKTDTRTGEPARLRLVGPPEPSGPPPELRPRLNAVVVGISAYRDPKLRLAYAAKDARDVAAALEAQRGRGLYREVNLRVLADLDATRTGVLRALDWLLRETTSNDVAVVFLAGHGLMDQGKTFFLPADGNPEQLFATAVAQSDLQGILSQVAGRVVAFVDICHAGAAVLAQNQRGSRAASLPDMTAFVNQLLEPGSGLIVFAGTTAKQPAVELPERRNGAFTAALLDGLRGGADLNRDGAVRTDELNVFVADRVRELTSGRQHPVMQRPGDLPDFPFALNPRQPPDRRTRPTRPPMPPPDPRCVAAFIKYQQGEALTRTERNYIRQGC